MPDSETNLPRGFGKSKGRPSETEERVTLLEWQVDRVISDIESEKGTRSRAHEALHVKLDNLMSRMELKLEGLQGGMNTRLEKCEHFMWWATGGLAVLTVVLKFIGK